MTDSIYDPILRDLEEIASSLPPREATATSIDCGLCEMTALLDAYSGPLPTSNARRLFHLDYDGDRRKDLPPTGPYVHVWLPEPLARDSGIATRVVSTAHLLRLFASDLVHRPQDPEWLAFVEQYVQYYSAMPAPDAPSPLPYLVAAYHYPSRLAGYAEMAAVIAALPQMPSQHAVIHLRWMLQLQQDVSCGRDYQQGICISRPSTALGYPECSFLDIAVGHAFHLIARDCVDKDPAKAADLLALADRYYLDGDLQVEVDGAGSEAFWVVEPEYVDKDEVERIMNLPSANLLPGSVKLVPYTNQSRYSPDDDAFEYRLAHYLEEFDDDEDDDYEYEPEERALLLGPKYSYTATVSRPSKSGWN